MTSIIEKYIVRAAALVCALAGTALVHANSTYKVLLDTSSLIGSPDAPLSLDFQLNDGAGFGDGNTTVKVSNFKFGGGSATDFKTTVGGASGRLATGITLVDTSPYNEYYEQFIPGTWLSFTVNLSTSFISGGTPDFFSFAILDGNLMNLATRSFGSDNFLEINIDRPSPGASAFSSADGEVRARVPDVANSAVCAAAALAVLFGLRRHRLIPA